MNNKRKLTLMFAAMSGFVTASDTSSVGYMQQASDVFHSVYHACNAENLQNLGNVILAKAVEAKKAVAVQAESLGAACATAYEACNKDNVQNAFKYVQGQAKEHPWITGAIVATPILVHVGYKLYSSSEKKALTPIEQIVKDVIDHNQGIKTVKGLRVEIHELFDYDHQTLERQKEIDNACIKFNLVEWMVIPTQSRHLTR